MEETEIIFGPRHERLDEYQRYFGKYISFVQSQANGGGKLLNVKDGIAYFTNFVSTRYDNNGREIVCINPGILEVKLSGGNFERVFEVSEHYIKNICVYANKRNLQKSLKNNPENPPAQKTE